MNIVENSSVPDGAESRRLYIENLLAKYPTTTDAEKGEILSFITKASALDVALLTCNQAISEKLNAFKHDHRKQLGFTVRNWINFAALLGLVTVAVYFLSNFGV